MKGWDIGMKYEFIGNQGDFYMENPDLTSYLYFPLANESGVMSCVSPDLGGDSKMDQNSFFLCLRSAVKIYIMTNPPEMYGAGLTGRYCGP